MCAQKAKVVFCCQHSYARLAKRDELGARVDLIDIVAVEAGEVAMRQIQVVPLRLGALQNGLRQRVLFRANQQINVPIGA